MSTIGLDVFEKHDSKKEQDEADKGGVLSGISCFACRLSNSIARSAFVSTITAGLMPSMPSQVVEATRLVGQVQAAAVQNIADRAMFYCFLPETTATARLVKDLVLKFTALSPRCLREIASLTPAAAAETAALGGVVPLLVAAALQESIEVSRLVRGQSTVYQFGRKSGEVVAVLGGAVGGMAIGAAIGSAAMPGAGTGIGSITGSIIGGMVVPSVFVGDTSTPKEERLVQQMKEQQGVADPKVAESRRVEVEEEIQKIIEKSQSSFHFLIDPDDDDDDDVDGKDRASAQQQQQPQDSLNDDQQRQQQQSNTTDMKKARRELAAAGKALLAQCTIVPQQEVHEYIRQSQRNLNAVNNDDDDEKQQKQPASPSSTNFVRSESTSEMLSKVPGTVFMLEAKNLPPAYRTRLAASSSAALRENDDDDHDDPQQRPMPTDAVQIGGAAPNSTSSDNNNNNNSNSNKNTGGSSFFLATASDDVDAGGDVMANSPSTSNLATGGQVHAMINGQEWGPL